jgi:hypothetical protein
MRISHLSNCLFIIAFGVSMFGVNGFAANLIYVYNYGPATFTVDDLEATPRALDAFLMRLEKRQWHSGKPDLVSSVLYEQSDDATHKALDSYAVMRGKIQDRFSDSGIKELKMIVDASNIAAVLVTNLNRIIQRPCIYEKKRFQDVELRDQTKSLLMQNPKNEDLVRLNWLLLKDAYPEFARSAIEANGTIRGFLKRKEAILHIEICLRKLSASELQDYWIALSPTNRVALSEITEDTIKPYKFSHYLFKFENNRLVRFNAEVYGYGYPHYQNGSIVSIGSFKNETSLVLPCSVEDFEKVFGKPDEIARKTML